MNKSILLWIVSTLLLLGCQSKQDSATNQEQQSQLPAKKVTWRLAQSWNSNLPIIADGTQKFSKLVNQLSDGRFTIIIDAANKHKSPFGIFDFVKLGQYQMGHSASYYWKGKNFNTLFFTTVPFGMTAIEQYAWYYHGGGQQLATELYSQYGIRSYPGGNTGAQMGGWFNKKIETVADFQGLKMRIPGFAGEVLAKLGVKPVNIAAGELYTALDRNTIDALEWIGPSLDLRMGFPKIAKYYYGGWHEPGAELQFMVNQQAYDDLPTDLQVVLETAMRVSAFDMYVNFYHESAKNLAIIKQQYPDVQFETFPKEVMIALYEANMQLLMQFSDKDPLTQKIIKSQLEYMAEVRNWTHISDQSYLNAIDFIHAAENRKLPQ